MFRLYASVMAHPLLYEVNARQWLLDLSIKHSKAITLSCIPEEDLNGFRKHGFTHLWLMGVWPPGPKISGTSPYPSRFAQRLS